MFTDHAMGGNNVAPDILPAQWVRLQPIKSQRTWCQCKKVFSEEQLLIELCKTCGTQSAVMSGGESRQDETFFGIGNPSLIWNVSLSKGLTQCCSINM